MTENNTQLLMYESADGITKIEVKMQDETVWLSIDQMAELFGRDKSTISRHIKMYLKKENWNKKWLLQILQQPLSTVPCRIKLKPMKLLITTWT